VSRWKILSTGDVERYLLHEFILELCTAIHFNSYSNRRIKLVELLSRHKWTRTEISKIRKVFIKIISWIHAIFPKDSIMHTRFKNKSDFYSLFIVLVKFLNEGYVSDDGKSNRIAGNFLLEFSKHIQKLDPKIKAFDSPELSSSERKLLSYVISTKQSTDDINNREIRHNYLISILRGGFILKKDAKRIFDQNVKDFLWTEITQKQKNPKCPNPLKNKKCKKHLTYDYAQVDHKHPWSKGGKTTLRNAQLICSSCNSSKGKK
jgi:5-methylcytosine-specific restriction endonuclease McrA